MPVQKSGQVEANRRTALLAAAEVFSGQPEKAGAFATHSESYAKPVIDLAERMNHWLNEDVA